MRPRNPIDMGIVISVVAAAAALILLAVVWHPARAQHQHHHPLHHDFYRHWKQPGTNSSCCDARIEKDGKEVGDCEPTRAEPRVDKDGVVRWFFWIRQLGQWLPAADDRLLRERNPTGQTGHVCWTAHRGIICGLPPDTGG